MPDRECLLVKDFSVSCHDEVLLAIGERAYDGIVNTSLDPIGSATDDHFDVGLGHVHDHLAARAGLLDDPPQTGQAQQTGRQAFDDPAGDEELGQSPKKSLNGHAPHLPRTITEPGVRWKAQPCSESWRYGVGWRLIGAAARTVI